MRGEGCHLIGWPWKASLRVAMFEKVLKKVCDPDMGSSERSMTGREHNKCKGPEAAAGLV